jgi:hypothetical protein
MTEYYIIVEEIEGKYESNKLIYNSLEDGKKALKEQRANPDKKNCILSLVNVVPNLSIKWDNYHKNDNDIIKHPINILL